LSVAIVLLRLAARFRCALPFHARAHSKPLQCSIKTQEAARAASCRSGARRAHSRHFSESRCELEEALLERSVVEPEPIQVEARVLNDTGDPRGGGAVRRRSRRRARVRVTAPLCTGRPSSFIAPAVGLVRPSSISTASGFTVDSLVDSATRAIMRRRARARDTGRASDERLSPAHTRA
jgi:hypothetical protein